MKKLVGLTLLVLFLIFVGIQFVPADTTNPPVEHEVVWANAQTKETFLGACSDCHSNETVWPWYSKVAPVSWWIAHHVDEGREHFNISVADMGDADEAYEAAHDGWMPLTSYTWMHPKARLTQAQRDTFAEGLKQTFNQGKESSDHKEEEESEE